ncbi:MAG: hypothetical protein NTZ13_05230 [Candidatus Parcubacteria bacterium]|nr:hypothetical protein [Candidatus Parcubacteria bacterium]
MTNLYVSPDDYKKVRKSDISKIETFEDAKTAFCLRENIQQALQENCEQQKARFEMEKICQFILDHYGENLATVEWVSTHAEFGKARTLAHEMLR